MTIRKAVYADVPYLLDIYNYEIENGVATLDIDKKSIEDWEKWFFNHNVGNHPLIVCEIDGAVAGYASLSSYREKQAYSSTVELSVYVSPDYRRMGVGTLLMKEILKMAREDETIHTVVSVITSSNTVSCRLHERLGFTFCGTIKEVAFKFGEYIHIHNYSLKV